MNDYLSNLSSRSFDRTEGIPSVSPRVPSLFEPWQEPSGISIEIPSRFSVNHQPGDETPPPSLAKAGAKPTSLEQTPGKYSEVNMEIPMVPEDISLFHGNSMEILTATAERALDDHEPAITAPPPQDPSTITVLQTSAKPPDKISLEPQVRDGAQEETATSKETLATIEPPVPTPIEKGRPRPFSIQESRNEWSTQAQNKSCKERTAVENVIVKERVERIFDRDVSSGADLGEHHNIIMPTRTQQPLHHPLEPILNPWKNPDLCEPPEKAKMNIQVTIGRIEVRATTAPAQSRPKTKAPTSMSLEDYLKRRNGVNR